MNRILRQIAVIARRDFLAIVAAPTFILFLLAPLTMIAFGAVGGTSAAMVGRSGSHAMRIVAVAAPADADQLARADADLRLLYRENDAPPALKTIIPSGDAAMQARQLFADRSTEVTAVMTGALSAPRIEYRDPSERHARYLGALADRVERVRRSGIALDASPSHATLVEANAVAKAAPGAQTATAFSAVFVIFLLTLLLAGQAVGTLTEEKSNKVIEILAAAVPLEAVFLGKLIGLFGVALVFVAFWATLGSVGASLLPTRLALSSLAPAIGLPMFLVLGGLYFTMAFLLLGAVFLGIGAQASTMREIQMMSLPITIFQVSMFGLASAAASTPGSALAHFAQVFPFSSPFAMAARGATDATLWPHLAALAWQALWVAATIWISARMFRIGVLKSGGMRPRWLGRK